MTRLVFLPGFSTAEFITDVSGRGVGLDVVLNRIEALHGTVDVDVVVGAGSRFTLTVSLTLTTIRTVLTVAGGQTFAVATAHMQQLVRFGAADIRSVGGRDVLLLGQSPIPISSLAETLGAAQREPAGPNEKVLGLVLSAGDQQVVFLVDQVLSEQDVVVKTLGHRIRRMRHVSAATLLPSGQVALVLNVAALVRTALGRTSARSLLAAAGARAEVKRRLLIAEDSMTTRTLVKSILETAGYDVVTAVDGEQAWQMLPDANVDLVVSDIDMPKRDGFELTAAIRSSKRFAELPVVLVTARKTDEDKTRGIEVGANAYLVKSAFDQSLLLEAISQLL